MAEKKQERKADDRVRNFATVVYVESLRNLTTMSF